MKAAFDTNILVYAAGANDAVRQLLSQSLLHAALQLGGIIPTQVLAEYFRVMTRKYRWTSRETAEQIERYRLAYDIAPTTSDDLGEALDLSTGHQIQIFDAIIIAASARAGCRVLFSEDMQHDAVFNGVTIINPFLDAKHPMLRAVLK
ncbi:MAG: PIN domain-containing protein [Beijerinckiaceae bacterium]